MRIALIVVIVIVVVVLIGVVGFVIWASDAAQPMPEALAALEDTDQVDVSQQNGWWVFTPTGDIADAGFIFYPGGKVDARAYAPLAQDVAEAGYRAVIVQMPLNLAVFGINLASGVREAFPDTADWVIGGHSLGGAMASSYAASNDDVIDGLALLASFPASDISAAGLAVSSIYGTLDGLSTLDSIDASRPNLPADTVFVRIDGGNHAQFGWYGPQSSDNPATISHEEQQALTSAAVIDLMARVDAAP
jgi:hypothetical protein